MVAKTAKGGDRGLRKTKDDGHLKGTEWVCAA